MSIYIDDALPVVKYNGLNVKNTVCTLPSGTTIGGSAVVALATITSSSANALTTGPNGATNPSFNVDASTASAATGINIKSAAAAAGVAVSVISSGTDETLKIDAKGAGNIIIGGTSTGALSLGRTSTAFIIGGAVNTAIATQNATPTAAQIIGGLITHASTTAPGTLQLPTGTQMDTAVAGVTNGDSLWLMYVNTGNQTVTITAGVGFTITGTAAVPTLKNAQLYCVRTGVNTWIGNITLSA